MEGLVGPALAGGFADGAKVLEGEFGANAAPAAQVEHAVDAAGAGLVVGAFALMLDGPEFITEPETDVVGAVGGELVEPALESREAGCFIG